MTRKHPAFLALPLLALVLASCGGGGGGGGSSGGSNGGGGGGGVTFTPDRTSITFEFMEGSGAGRQEIVVAASGDLPNPLYIGAIADGSGIDPNITIIISGTSATFQIGPATGLAVGTYSGRIQLMGCSDSACTRQVGNSPIIISYRTTVQPRLKIAPTTVTLNAVSGNTASADVTVTLPWQQTSQDATVLTSSSWLSLVALSPTSWRLTARSMPSGTRDAIVKIASGPYSLELPVTYVVTAPPGGDFDLRSNPASFTFSATENTGATPATLTVLGPSVGGRCGDSLLHQLQPTTLCRALAGADADQRRLSCDG